MHSLKRFTFTLNLLLLLLSFTSQKPLVEADIEQVTLHDQSSLSLSNNNSFASESDEEDNLKISPSIEADITASKFAYLMKFGLTRYKSDTNVVYVNATPDTGSDLIWFHSKPCDYLLGCDCTCYDKGECMTKPDHIFGCEKCKQSNNNAFNFKCYKKNDNELCWYDLKYGDETESEGFYGRAYLQFTPGESDKSGEMNEQTLSVGFATTKKEDDVPERNGLVGLGLGELSFINQYEGMPKKFSYYLPQFLRQDEPEMKKRSKIKFGGGVEISKKSTPLVRNRFKFPKCETRYCIQLKNIRLKFKGEDGENYKLKASEGVIEEDDVIIIDSGCTMTYLNDKRFKPILNELKLKLEDKNPRELIYYKNCFEKKNGNVEKLEHMSFEFEGTTIELKKENIFDEYIVPDCNGGDPKTYVCLTIEGQDGNKGYQKRLRSYGTSNGKPQILGSRAQMDFTVAFDVANGKKVSFENHEKVPDSGSFEKVSLENNEKNPVL